MRQEESEVGDKGSGYDSEDLLFNNEHLSERQYKTILAHREDKKMNNVVKGCPHYLIDQQQSVKRSDKVINDHRLDPNNPFK